MLPLRAGHLQEVCPVEDSGRRSGNVCRVYEKGKTSFLFILFMAYLLMKLYNVRLVKFQVLGVPGFSPWGGHASHGIKNKCLDRKKISWEPRV